MAINNINNINKNLTVSGSTSNHKSLVEIKKEQKQKKMTIIQIIRQLKVKTKVCQFCGKQITNKI